MTPVTWMRVDEITQRLKISRATLYRLMQRGLPHHKVGRVVRFDLDEVDAWLKKPKRARGAKGRRR